MNRELVTAPTLTAITLAEAKAHLFVEHAEDDTLITGLIGQATDFAEVHLGLRLLEQTWRYYYDCSEVKDEVFVPEPVVSAISSVTYLTGTAVPYTVNVMPSAEYEYDIGNWQTRIKFVDGVPTIADTYNSFYVELVCGYPDAASVPDSIKTALLLIVGHLYKNRESVVVGTIASELPMGVLDFLNRHRVYDL